MSNEIQVKARTCINCGEEMPFEHHINCNSCGWATGLIPVAHTQEPDGSISTLFIGEVRHKFMAFSIFLSSIGGILATIGGILGLLASPNSPDPGGQTAASLGVLLIGIICAVSGIAAWRITEFGGIWKGLSPGEKALSVPGIALGFVAAWAAYIAIMIPWTALKATFSRD